jgi:hypothetical protein
MYENGKRYGVRKSNLGEDNSTGTTTDDNLEKDSIKNDTLEILK